MLAGRRGVVAAVLLMSARRGGDVPCAQGGREGGGRERGERHYLIQIKRLAEKGRMKGDRKVAGVIPLTLAASRTASSS